LQIVSVAASGKLIPEFLKLMQHSMQAATRLASAFPRPDCQEPRRLAALMKHI
jgi:hypothetical protein